MPPALQYSLQRAGDNLPGGGGRPMSYDKWLTINGFQGNGQGLSVGPQAAQVYNANIPVRPVPQFISSGRMSSGPTARDLDIQRRAENRQRQALAAAAKQQQQYEMEQLRLTTGTQYDIAAGNANADLSRQQMAGQQQFSQLQEQGAINQVLSREEQAARMRLQELAGRQDIESIRERGQIEQMIQQMRGDQAMAERRSMNQNALQLDDRGSERAYRLEQLGTQRAYGLDDRATDRAMRLDANVTGRLNQTLDSDRRIQELRGQQMMEQSRFGADAQMGLAQFGAKTQMGLARFGAETDMNLERAQQSGRMDLQSGQAGINEDLQRFGNESNQTNRLLDRGWTVSPGAAQKIIQLRQQIDKLDEAEASRDITPAQHDEQVRALSRRIQRQQRPTEPPAPQRPLSERIGGQTATSNGFTIFEDEQGNRQYLAPGGTQGESPDQKFSRESREKRAMKVNDLVAAFSQKEIQTGDGTYRLPNPGEVQDYRAQMDHLYNPDSSGGQFIDQGRVTTNPQGARMGPDGRQLQAPYDERMMPQASSPYDDQRTQQMVQFAQQQLGMDPEQAQEFVRQSTMPNAGQGQLSPSGVGNMDQSQLAPQQEDPFVTRTPEQNAALAQELMSSADNMENDEVYQAAIEQFPHLAPQINASAIELQGLIREQASSVQSGGNFEAEHPEKIRRMGELLQAIGNPEAYADTQSPVTSPAQAAMDIARNPFPAMVGRAKPIVSTRNDTPKGIADNVNNFLYDLHQGSVAAVTGETPAAWRKRLKAEEAEEEKKKKAWHDAVKRSKSPQARSRYHNR